MKQLKIYTIIGIFFVFLTGTLSHFVYDWSKHNSIVGLFAPVSESVWEHMKLLFFPMLLYSLFVIFKLNQNRSCIASSFFFGILTGTLLIPVFFYGYIVVLGKDVFILDLLTFMLSIVIAFFLAYRLTLSCSLQSYTVLLCTLVCILGICFVLFTYHPPDLEIFTPPHHQNLQ